MQNEFSKIKKNLVRAGQSPNQCLSVREVEQFEAQHKVQLPLDYRNFLLYIGNGGDDVMRLGQVPYYLSEQGGLLKEAWADFQYISEPFPFSEPWIWEGEIWNDETENKVLEAYHGNLLLRDNGCGLYDVLIVVGKEKGKVWQIADVGVCPIEPQQNFLQWVEGVLKE